jgi:2-oxoglutarate dehydrogenase complex dehydrogenase (E1) component-like enzyme
MGAYTFVQPRLDQLLEQMRISKDGVTYIGRDPANTPATGFSKRHKEEQKQIISKALE